MDQKMIDILTKLHNEMKASDMEVKQKIGYTQAIQDFIRELEK